MNNQAKGTETLQPGGQAASGAEESGAGYGNAQTGHEGGMESGGGMDSSGGTGSDGDASHADQAVQRSETIEAEDIDFEADDDLIDNDKRSGG